MIAYWDNSSILPAAATAAARILALVPRSKTNGLLKICRLRSITITSRASAQASRSTAVEAGSRRTNLISIGVNDRKENFTVSATATSAPPTASVSPVAGAFDRLSVLGHADDFDARPLRLDGRHVRQLARIRIDSTRDQAQLPVAERHLVPRRAVLLLRDNVTERLRKIRFAVFHCATRRVARIEVRGHGVGIRHVADNGNHRNPATAAARHQLNDLGCSVAYSIYSIGGCYTCYIVYYTIVLHSVLDANFGI